MMFSRMRVIREKATHLNLQLSVSKSIDLARHPSASDKVRSMKSMGIYYFRQGFITICYFRQGYATIERNHDKKEGLFLRFSAKINYHRRQNEIPSHNFQSKCDHNVAARSGDAYIRERSFYAYIHR
jgi:hypothetical protein